VSLVGYFNSRYKLIGAGEDEPLFEHIRSKGPVPTDDGY